MDTYLFYCRRCGHYFTNEAGAPSRMLHLLLGTATLGIWLAGYALFRLFHLFWISKCGDCGKRPYKIFAIFLFFFMGTLETGWVIYYFTEIAPAHIIQEYTAAELPDDLDLQAEATSDNVWPIVKYITAVAIFPALGSYISNNWPYMLLIWGSIVVIAGFSIPSSYIQKNEV